MKPENMPFASKLRGRMKELKLSQSSLARRIWGSYMEKRIVNGRKRTYNTAKNRDRIKHYLDANSLPDPDNMGKLEDALELARGTMEDLRPAPAVGAADIASEVRVTTKDDVTRLFVKNVRVTPEAARMITDLIEFGL